MSDDTLTNEDGEPVTTLHELVQHHQREYDLSFEEDTAMWRFVEDMHDHILQDMCAELKRLRVQEKKRTTDCDVCDRSSERWCYAHSQLFRKITDFVNRLKKPKFM